MKRIVTCLLMLVIVLSLSPSAHAETYLDTDSFPADYFVYNEFAIKPNWPLHGSQRHILHLDHYSGGSVHGGIDFEAAIGTDVYAVGTGTVVSVENSRSDTPSGVTNDMREYGNYVDIRHEINGEVYYSRYAHMKMGSIVVSVGSSVNSSTFLGHSGESGHTDGAHLHFELVSETVYNMSSGNTKKAERGKTFMYYIANPDVLVGTSFNTAMGTKSAYFKEWIKENCVQPNGTIYYCTEESLNTYSTAAQQYIDQCTSEPCNVILTVTTAGNMKNMPCSINTNVQSETVEGLTLGATYPSSLQWINTEGNVWYQVNSKTDGRRGFIYSGDVSVSNPSSTLSVSGQEAGTPSGTLTQGSSFGLRGVISSNYPITHIEAYIKNPDGTDALPYYSRDWDKTEGKTEYNIRYDGINSHFSFKNLPNGTGYHYIVSASDSSGTSLPLISSYFNVGTSTPTVTKPDMPTVSVTNSQYTAGDSITISWTASARNEYYWINVVKDGTKIVDQSMGTSLSYTLTNAQAGSYIVYVSANNSAGTSGSSNCTFSVNVIFDLNGCLDGNPDWGSLEGYGAVDIYMNGNLVASGVGDYCASWPVGTSYEIRNVQAFDGKHYDGVYSGSLSGTIGAERVNVILSFSSLTFLNLDGFLDGVANDGLQQYGTADIYVNGSLVGSGWNDYWAVWHYGSTYEIKNIRANDGYRYNGVRSGALSGTIGKDRIDVVLSFSTVHTYAFDSNGGSGSMSSIQVALGDPVVFPACAFTKEDAVFQGWQAYRPADNKYAIEFVGWRTAEEMAAAGLTPTKYPGLLSFDFNATWTEGTTGPITIVLSPVWALPDFTLPAALTTIESEAFTGGAFTYVKLPENAVSIGWHAFADCPNLAYIYIPALTTQIDEDAFGNLQGLTILGKANSVAETYAKEHHYTFIATD